MRKSTASVATALLLLLSATAAVVAAAPATSDPSPAALSAPADGAPLLAEIFAAANPTPAVPTTLPCGLRQYFCRPCPDANAVDRLQLCYTITCSASPVLFCDACQPTCILPPS